MNQRNRRTRAERARRARLIERHVEASGPVCPGWAGKEHAASDLVAFGAEVLCRGCAGRRANEEANAALVDRIAALERRVKALEDRPPERVADLPQIPQETPTDAGGLFVAVLDEGDDRW